MAAARAADVAAVYVAAGSDTVASVARTVASAGWVVPLVGPGALREGGFIEAAGPAAESVVATTSTATGATAEPSSDLAARTSAAGLDDPGPFGAAAYDAATAVLDAMSRCLPSADSVVDAREGCVAEMSQVSIPGETGPVAFTEYGERAAPAPVLWQVRAGTWVPVG